MSNLRSHRESILKALTFALDSCIEAAEERPELTTAAGFETEFVFTFQGTKNTVRSRPELNLTRDVEEQISRKSMFVDPTGEPLPVS